MHHSRAGMVHSFSARFKTRYSSFMAASSVGKCPLARTARRSFAGAALPAQLCVECFDSIRRIKHAPDLDGKGVERHHLSPGPAPALGNRRVLAAPSAVREGGQGGLTGSGIHSPVDVL